MPLINSKPVNSKIINMSQLNIINITCDKCAITYPIKNHHKAIQRLNKIIKAQNEAKSDGRPDPFPLFQIRYVRSDDHYSHNYMVYFYASEVRLSFGLKHLNGHDGRLSFNLWRITDDELTVLRELLIGVVGQKTVTGISRHGSVTSMEYAVDYSNFDDDRYFLIKEQYGNYSFRYSKRRGIIYLYYGNKLLKQYDKTPKYAKKGDWDWLRVIPQLPFKFTRVEYTDQRTGMSPFEIYRDFSSPFEDSHIVDITKLDKTRFSRSHLQHIRGDGFDEFCKQIPVVGNYLKLRLPDAEVPLRNNEMVNISLRSSLRRMCLVFGSDEQIAKYREHVPLIVGNYIHPGFVSTYYLWLLERGMGEPEFDKYLLDTFGVKTKNQALGKPLTKQDAIAVLMSLPQHKS